MDPFSLCLENDSLELHIFKAFIKELESGFGEIDYKKLLTLVLCLVDCAEATVNLV